MVILGGGIAEGNAAVTLREEGSSGPVVIISREPGVPFGRPPLSKTYLRSEEDLADWYVRAAGWYEAHGVDLLAGSSATAGDPAGHMVVLGSDRELGYQKLLLATGGRNRRLQVPGADLPGIHYLRTVADCDAIKARSRAGPARGSDRHGVHRLRGDGLPHAAWGRRDLGLSGQRTVGAGPGRVGRCGDRRNAPLERGQAPGRSQGGRV
jgi:NADPH-dependent 2,4-dienoyl-CoA reductase/sulfur reductase-like enzyme